MSLTERIFPEAPIGGLVGGCLWALWGEPGWD